MKNDAKQNYSQGNRNFQDSPKGFGSQKSNEDPNQGFYIVYKGFPHYGKKIDLNLVDSWSNYDDDKKNTEQEDYPDDTDFEQNPKIRKPNQDEDDDSDAKIEEDEDLEEQTNLDDETYPDESIIPEERNDNYLSNRGNSTNIYDL